MKNLEDLTASVKRMHSQYSADRIDREILRGWLLGLGGYLEPHASALADAVAWFKPVRDMPPEELKARDLAFLQAIVDAGLPAPRAAGILNRV